MTIYIYKDLKVELDSLYDEVDTELINKYKIKYTELSIQRNCRIKAQENQLDLFEI